MCAGTWERDNVAIISLNTFEMVEVEINRYDAEGKLIEERAGNISMRREQPEEDGFRISITENPDQGYALLTVEPSVDQWADRRKAAGFLCEDCLEKILPEEGREKMGFGVIDLSTGEIKVFDRQILGFEAGNFYVHCDWEKYGTDLDLLIFYDPVRY